MDHRKLMVVVAALSCVALGSLRLRADVTALPLSSAQIEQEPYKFTGLLLTDAGQGSGAVVRQSNIVLSCAHVVFDDQGLLDPWSGDVRWYPKYHAAIEPSPFFGKALRGYSRFSSYQFVAQNYGNSISGAFEWDIVAHYAYESLANGDFASGWTDGVSALRAPGPKMITGYPGGLYPIGHPDRSRMHSTGPFSNALRVERGAFLGTDGVTTGNGNSGGPVWARDASGTWLFAGVLVSGTRKVEGGAVNSLGVRAMDPAAWALVAEAMGAAPPANDHFANRAVLGGLPTSVSGSNLGATKEAGEPDHADGTGGKSVWWTWTAPANGTVTFDTSGSSFDTLLAVYTGNAVSSLALVARSGDSDISRATFNAVQGTAYQIAVDELFSSGGRIVLNLTPAPANDHFTARAVIADSASPLIGSNIGATVEPGEPNHIGQFGGKSVWWTWTARTSGTVTVDTIGSEFDTMLAVYTGNSVSNIAFLVGDDEGGVGGTSRLTFSSVAGTDYQIVVDGFEGEEGRIVLNVRPGIYISAQPVGRIVALGGSVSFGVTAAGTSSPTYQWRRNGVALAGATNFIFTITNAQTINGGTYDVVVRDATASLISSNAVLTVANPYTFTTMAGSPVVASADGVGSEGRFNSPCAVAVDSAGNIYVADQSNHTIRKITAAGVVSTLAGSAGLSGSANGTGSAARFNFPSGVVVDGSGNVIVADRFNHTIRRITPAGVVSTLAGSAGLNGSADGTGGAARFYYPIGVALDRSGNLYVADQFNHTIRKMTPAGAVSTLAGLAGNQGRTEGAGNLARFAYPGGVAVNAAGNIYVTDGGNDTIRQITPAGVVSTLAGSAGNSGGADGPGNAAGFKNPMSVAVDAAGSVFVADQSNHTIRKITPAGLVSTLAGLAGQAGFADGMGNSARFSFPSGVAVDASGNVIVADTQNNSIRKITPSGAVNTLSGKSAYGSADGTKDAASFYGLDGLAVDGSGNVFVADNVNHTIRKITASGIVSTLAGLAGVAGSADGTGSQARFDHPESVAVDRAGNVYVPDFNNHTIRKITAGGLVTTLAGLAGSHGSTDGTGPAARFLHPAGVAVDNAGNVFVADQYNHTIRKMTPAGTVTTLAGSAGNFGSDDGVGSAARFSGPESVAVDSVGNLYVADYANSTIRKVSPGGVVSTLAGIAGFFGSTDGVGPAARFRSPNGVAVDSAGNVYVADTRNSSIRMITPDGVVSTLAGSTIGLSGSVDGIGTTARFYLPNSVAVDSAGNLYVSDTGNNTIRKGLAFTITVQPRAQIVTGGANVVLSVAAASITPLTYQWWKDGVSLPGATNANYTITNSQPQHSGLYNATIANLGSSLASSNVLLVVVPVNDSFASRSVISGLAGTVTGVNLGAIKEAGEPNHTGDAGGRSVWWTWTAPANGPVTIDTFGSSFDTLLAVYTGGSVSTLALVVNNDDDGDFSTSKLTFFGVAGTEYQIAVDGYDGDSGSVVLNLRLTPVALPNPPQITSQPQAQTLTAGNSVTFSVTATGSGSLLYQWRKDGAAIIGATNASYTVVNAQESNAGAYVAVVSGGGISVTSNPAILTVIDTTKSARGDINGDGQADILFQDADGNLATWIMKGANLVSAAYLSPFNPGDAGLRIAATADFDRDGQEDILFQHKDGTLLVWFMRGTSRIGASLLDPRISDSRDWRVAAAGDMNGDEKSDLVVQHVNGTLAVWFMDGITVRSSTLLNPILPGDARWRVAGIGDFNGDAWQDLVFQHEDGTLSIWFLNGVTLVQSSLLSPPNPGPGWRVAGVADRNQDGKPDLLFQHTNLDLAVWLMDGAKLISAQLLNPKNSGGTWNAVAPK